MRVPAAPTSTTNVQPHRTVCHSPLLHQLRRREQCHKGSAAHQQRLWPAGLWDQVHGDGPVHHSGAVLQRVPGGQRLRRLQLNQQRGGQGLLLPLKVSQKLYFYLCSVWLQARRWCSAALQGEIGRLRVRPSSSRRLRHFLIGIEKEDQKAGDQAVLLQLLGLLGRGCLDQYKSFVGIHGLRNVTSWLTQLHRPWIGSNFSRGARWNPPPCSTTPHPKCEVGSH
jgi:hypothetical protein